MSDTAVSPQPVIIKKYANRRLYNTDSSSYVTLESLSAMVKANRDFVVYDAKTGEDITRSVLTQIIVEEEQKGENLLPISFLRQLIGLYGDNMQWLVPRYLDYSMKSFTRNQEQMRSSLQSTLGGLFPFAPFEEMGKQNLALFERAMKMFAGSGAEGMAAAAGRQGSPTPERLTSEGAQRSPDMPVQTEAGMRELIERLNLLQRQVDDLTHKEAPKAEEPSDSVVPIGKKTA